MRAQDGRQLLYNEKISAAFFTVSLAYSRTMRNINQMVTRIKGAGVAATRKPVYAYTRTSGADTLFYYGLDNWREDHMADFSKVAALVPRKDIVMPAAPRARENIPYTLGSVVGFFASLPYAVRSHWSWKEWAFSLADWFRLWHFDEFLQNVDFSHYKLIVVFCDADACSNLLVQAAKLHGCITATLQHGAFTAPQENPENVEDAGVELLASRSDYFLAWNGFTKDQAIKSGIPAQRIKILGIPKFIGSCTQCTHAPTGKFGIVLGWIDNDAENRAMIETANAVADELGMDYYLKYHPSFQGTEYETLVGPHYAGNIAKGISIEAYALQTDFSIVGKSSMLISLTFLGHPTYHQHVGDSFDKYSEIKQITFETAQELVALCRREEPLPTATQNYISGPIQVEQRYTTFFSEILGQDL